MLEAKNQGHKRKCSQKKKGLQKKFSGDLQKRKKKKGFQIFIRHASQNTV